jgi:hypothetical protein
MRARRRGRDSGDHVRLTVEGIDRMYLTVYVPDLQSAYGAVELLPFASPAAAKLIGADEPDEPAAGWFIARHKLPLVLFRTGQRKDDSWPSGFAVLLTRRAPSSFFEFRRQRLVHNLPDRPQQMILLEPAPRSSHS